MRLDKNVREQVGLRLRETLQKAVANLGNRCHRSTSNEVYAAGE
jgi:hypothetical protein